MYGEGLLFDAFVSPFGRKEKKGEEGGESKRERKCGKRGEGEREELKNLTIQFLTVSQPYDVVSSYIGDTHTHT